MNLEDILHFNAIDTAEKIAEKSNGTINAQKLGLSLAMANSAHKKELLKQMKDTYHSISIKDYLEILNESIFDFHISYEKDFLRDSKHQEKEYIISDSSRGILLYINTCNSIVNSANCYFQIKMPNIDWELLGHCSRSCADKQNQMSINIDAREAIIYKLMSFDLSGKIEWLSPWKLKENCIFLCNYTESNNHRNVGNFDEISKSKWFQLSATDQKIFSEAFV